MSDKAEILTEAEVDMVGLTVLLNDSNECCNIMAPWIPRDETAVKKIVAAMPFALSTIRQMAGLLEEQRGRIVSMGCQHSQCDGKVVLCGLCEKSQALLVGGEKWGGGR